MSNGANILQESEATVPLVGVLKVSEQDGLGALRAEVASLRERIRNRRYGERRARWQRVADVAVFLLLVTIISRREKPR